MTILSEAILADIPLIYKILLLILLAILPNMHQLAPILDRVAKKDLKKLKWINFLEYNKKIKCCMHDFKIGIALPFKSNVVGSLSGYILITLLFLTSIFVNGTTQSLYEHLISVSVTMVLAIFFLWYDVGKRISDIEICADFKRTNNYFSFASGLTFITTFAIIIFIFFTTLAFKYGKISTSNFILICMPYILVIIFLAGAKRHSNRIYKDLTHKLEFMLLEKYSETFPHIYVKADARELQGTIQDIFNDNFIVFGYNGMKIPVEWDKITSIKLSESAADEPETESTQDAIAESADEEKESQHSIIKNYLLRPLENLYEKWI